MDYQSKVLLVDDDEFSLHTLEMVLYNQGYELILAQNGKEALEKARQHQPDVILLDVMMPEMNGFEVCQHLRDDPVLAEVPIIIVTALDDKDSRLEGIEAGADDFITKPYDRLELRTRVRTITKLNRFRTLMSERNKFEWVVENAAEGYVIIDDEDVIVYANRKAKDFLGIDPSDLLDEKATFSQIANQTYRLEPEEAWENWPQPLPEKQPRYMVRPESFTAEPLWLQVDVLHSSPAQIGQRVVHLSDVTQQIVGERLSWAFHSQVSHKLRTPLGLFMGYLDLLIMDKEQMPEQTQMMLDLSVDSAQRLKGHLLDIFEYVDGVGSLKIEKQISIGDFVELATEIVERMEEGEFKAVNGGFPETAFAPLPKSALEMILEELFANAIKFHPEGKPTVTASIETDQENLILKIIDDGQRLPTEQLQDIWLPYFQAEKHFSGQIAGTGLGLAKIAAICWEVDGNYRAYNREDKPGIVIEIILPLVAKEASAPSESFDLLPDGELTEQPLG